MKQRVIVYLQHLDMEQLVIDFKDNWILGRIDLNFDFVVQKDFDKEI